MFITVKYIINKRSGKYPLLYTLFKNSIKYPFGINTDSANIIYKATHSAVLLKNKRRQEEYYMGARENFKRGSIEMLILFLLRSDDMYGYQLAQEINTKSEGLFDITEGSMYPTLYRLIEKGFISDRRELIGKRRVRVYYHIEKAGIKQLESLIEEFRSINSGIEKIISTPKPKVPAKKTAGRRKAAQEAEGADKPL